MLLRFLPRAVSLVTVPFALAGLLGTGGTASAAQAETSVSAPDVVTDDAAAVAAPLEGGNSAFDPEVYAGAARADPPPEPRYTFTTPPERPTPYVGQVSCEPAAKPGTAALRQLLLDTYGPSSIGTLRACSTGGRSEHKDGRALDWMLNAGNTTEKARADAFLAWLVGPDSDGVAGGNAHRLGVMYVIWNRQTWQSWTGAWKPYTGVSPHTDHIHISLGWNGAMKRTSWWTGVVAEKDDFGPCQEYVGELAPPYSGPRYVPCPAPIFRSGRAFPRLWDGDTSADVIAVTTTGALVLYPGTGAGSFGRATQIGRGWSSMSGATAMGDFDHDGRRDLVARDSSGRLYLYRGNGTGGFLGATQIGHGWGGMDTILGAGDLDNDGAVDLLARRASDGVAVVYRGAGDGRFGSAREVASLGSADLLIAAGDWDGDRVPDLLTRDAASGRLDLRPGDGRGGFRQPEQVGRGWGTMNEVIGTGDFSGDRKADLIARHANGRLWLYRGDGVGGFGEAVQIGHGWGALDLVR